MKRREFITLGAATLATGCAGVARRINHERSLAMYDVIIIGGSYAGLAAALQLVRARRRVLQTNLESGIIVKSHNPTGDIAHEAQPNPLHPQHGAHHHG
jgi:choline dehydrogenase-like flavoprotein